MLCSQRGFGHVEFAREQDAELVLSEPIHVVDGKPIKVESKLGRGSKKTKPLGKLETELSLTQSKGFFRSDSDLPTDPDFRSSTIDGGRTQTIFETHSPREMIRLPLIRDQQRNSFSSRQPPQIQSCKIIEKQQESDPGLQAPQGQSFFKIGHSIKVHSTEQLYENRPEENLFQQKKTFEMKRKKHPTSVKIDLETSFNLNQSPVEKQDNHFFSKREENRTPKPQRIEKEESQTSLESHGPRSTGTRYKVFYRHLKRLSTNRQSRCKRMTATVEYEQIVERKADDRDRREKRVDFFLDKLARILGSSQNGG